MKIVVLGSTRFCPYTFLAVPNPVPGYQDREEDYQKAVLTFYPAIREADEVWVYAPDGVGQHTRRDLEYALEQRKKIQWVRKESKLRCVECAIEHGGPTDQEAVVIYHGNSLCHKHLLDKHWRDPQVLRVTIKEE